MNLEVPPVQRGNRGGNKALSEAVRALRRSQESEAYCRERVGAAREGMKNMGDEMERHRRESEAMDCKIRHLRDRVRNFARGEPPSPRWEGGCHYGGDGERNCRGGSW